MDKATVKLFEDNITSSLCTISYKHNVIVIYHFLCCLQSHLYAMALFIVYDLKTKQYHATY